MQIQRIQTVYLLLALIGAVVTIFVPFGYEMRLLASGESLQSPLLPHAFMPMLILNVVIAALLLIDIFLYKNLKHQKSVLKVAMLLMAAWGACAGVYLYGPSDPETAAYINWYGGTLCLIAQLFFSWLALKGMNRDQKLLAGADRLR